MRVSLGKTVSPRLSKAVVIIISLIMVMAVAAFPESAWADTSNTQRVQGSDKYATSIAAANYMYKASGKFENVVVAYGEKHADALSGGYLARVKKAPIILVNRGHETNVKNYIVNYMKSSGTVYILGGTSVVRAEFETSLKNAGLKTKRLAGQDKYGTNLAVLKEVASNGAKILIAYGETPFDSLSASAVARPLLLVNKKLTTAQLNFLKSKNIKEGDVIGGTAVVSETVWNQLNNYSKNKWTRVSGANRYETSAKIANRYFYNAQHATFATGKGFADGLSGATVAIYNKAPLVLVDSNAFNAARYYVGDRGIRKHTVIGGTRAVSGTTINKIFAAPRVSVPSECTGQYVCGSKRSGWGSYLTLHFDGTFEGFYRAPNAKKAGSTYSGNFSSVKKTATGIWKAKLGKLKASNTFPGARFVSGGTNFLIMAKGASASKLSAEARNKYFVWGGKQITKNSKLPYPAIYNVKEDTIFVRP